jgi:hypothetical protein
VFTQGTQVAVPTLHPVAVLHRESMMEAVKEDFRYLRSIFAQGIKRPAQGRDDQSALMILRV